MRFIIVGIMFFSSMAMADNQTITLNPGSAITLNPGVQTTVQCLGTSSTAKFHCSCVNVAYQDYAVSHETLGYLTSGGYSTVAGCNQALRETFRTDCWY
jgi:hypothetical protein